MANRTKELKTRKCSACNTELPEDAKFCTVCGEPLPESSSPTEVTRSMCPECFAEFQSEVKVCKSCGSRTKPIVDTSQETTCPRCYSEIEPGLDYCPVCGSDIGSSATCPKCSANIPTGMSHCPACGTSRKRKETSSYAIREKLKIRRETNRDIALQKYEKKDTRPELKKEKRSFFNKAADTIDESLKKAVHDSQMEETIHQGYLVCNRCGGYYQLKPGESPDDFTNECQCGGKLEHKLIKN